MMNLTTMTVYQLQFKREELYTKCLHDTFCRDEARRLTDREFSELKACVREIDAEIERRYES
jgi:hypothetical protein